jgi:hypothetical protein
VPPQSAAPVVGEQCEAVADLREDRLTAWTPDVAGDADLPHLADTESLGSSSPHEHELSWIEVPTPQGGQMRVPVLHPALLLALHHATAGLRGEADAILEDGVLGYRYGARSGWHYAPAWRAFSDCVADLAATHAWVVFTDVSSFFACTSWEQVLAAVGRLEGETAGRDLEPVAQRFRRAGQDTLPSGYADARFLANLVLAWADREVGAPFVRWVDDYRLFADSETEARRALDRLHRVMREIGLRPNESKTRVLPGAVAAAENENTLASVYHPERDSRETVRANLTRVLERAAKDPVAKRRELRFALARLAREQDPSGVRWALDELEEIPWEAPRLVSYLSVFAAGEVADAADGILAAAARERDAWLIARLAPLVWLTGVAERSASPLANALPALDGTPAWGLALRVLARAGRRAAVQNAIHSQVADGRGALAALADLGCKPPQWLSRAEPGLAAALGEGPLPGPPVMSLL